MQCSLRLMCGVWIYRQISSVYKHSHWFPPTQSLCVSWSVIWLLFLACHTVKEFTGPLQPADNRPDVSMSMSLRKVMSARVLTLKPWEGMWQGSQTGHLAISNHAILLSHPSPPSSQCSNVSSQLLFQHIDQDSTHLKLHTLLRENHQISPPRQWLPHIVAF